MHSLMHRQAMLKSSVLPKQHKQDSLSSREA